ncbi:hypothetical protein LJ737_16680 [Hymenobacter sp. 15J16-1T3B]|uniref:hypothetical protein n=1 Tax=Hymenobacter sp. 15J16-1T3B TaxID=2886941 RepID=UPI001D10E65A|nr:hypothetical protein [Hymenobacter sp. 15J16-1T3B]MCC3158880.1 hypothetical protein [Hymenobacter sp. 15J16-1T3B]
MLEFVAEVLLNILFSYPGAGIRWLLHLGKVPYKKLQEDDAFYNAGAFFLLLIAIVVLAYLL